MKNLRSVCFCVTILFGIQLGCSGDKGAPRSSAEKTKTPEVKTPPADQLSDLAISTNKEAATKPGPADLDKDGSATSHHVSAISRKFFGPLPYKQVTESVSITPKPKANVLLIVLDALNPRHLSAYGYKRNTSPQIDVLAGQGLVLTNYVSNSSWTRPSYTTIITGLSKKDHGVELEGGWLLKPEITTIAERFQKAGYRTGGFTGNVLVRKNWGFGQGYHVYQSAIDLGLKAFPRDSIIINKALEWLRGVQDKPFFLSLFLTSSHPPYRPPAKYHKFLKEVPAGKVIEHPFKEYKHKLQKDDHDRIVAAYDDEIRYMDEQLQKLISYLEDSKQLDNTIIVLTADHGEIFGEHNCYLHAYHMWEPVLRVPFILVSPNIPLAGYVDERPFTHLDIVPTLLDLVGIQPTTGELGGVSLVRALEDLSINHNRYLFSQYNAHGVRRQAIRDDRFKLVHHHKVEKRAEKKLDQLHPSVRQPHPKDLPSLAWNAERYELYDLLEDPGELRDLFAEKKESAEVSQLMERLKLHIMPNNTVKQLPEEMIQALINTGYLRTDKPPAEKP